MSSLRNLLCAAAAVGLIFSASPAEARFGKRSSDSKQEKKTHEATAVGDEDSDGDDDDSSRSSSSRSRGSSGVSGFLTFLEVLSDVAEVAEAVNHTTTVVYTPPPPVVAQAQVQAAAPTPAAEVSSHTTTQRYMPLLVGVGMNGAPMGGGSAMDLFLTIDGERMGLDARGTSMSLPTDDGTAGEDRLSLGTVHLSYAMISRERIRLRLEGGLSMASAPDLAVAGPSLALSMEACVLGDLDVELRAQGTAFPYQQLDAQAGLALNLTHLVLRGGWRGLYLNDAGLVDGVVHQDAFSGPYLGLGFSF